MLDLENWFKEISFPLNEIVCEFFAEHLQKKLY